MARSAHARERNLLICFDNECSKCGWDERMVPASCEFELLHVLLEDTFPFAVVGEREMKRQAGKTTALLRIANAIIASGRNVLLVEPTHLMKDYVRSALGLRNRSELVLMSFPEILGGRARGFRGHVLTDEIYGHELDTLRRLVCPNRVLASYYTLPEHG